MIYSRRRRESRALPKHVTERDGTVADNNDTESTDLRF